MISPLSAWRFCVVAVILSCASIGHAAEKLKTENVFLIVVDGLRWQEVFGGADESLINLEGDGVRNTNATRQEFWRNTPEERRTTLLPFFWSEIAEKGQLFGNTNKGSHARITNSRKFSYPGYNEVLTGAEDPRINSNDKRFNPNVTVFEWLNGRPKFTGRVAALGSWDVFPYIFNVERSRLPIWPVWEKRFAPYEIKVPAQLQSIAFDTTPLYPGTVMDSFIVHAARDYINKEKPKVLYLGFGEPDTWAHGRRYDLYLSAIHHMDRMVGDLWQEVQSMREYRDKTTFLITCDHGRGGTPKDWTDHGAWVPGAEDIWIAVIGPDTAPLGERANAPAGQNQIAATVAAFLGEDYGKAFPKVGRALEAVVQSSR